MKVGIIEAGEPPPVLVPTFGSYVTMTRQLLGQAHDYVTFRAVEGCLPHEGACDAYVITGSACSVYDDRPWMRELECFLRSVRQRAKLVGICFGHQIMAQAFGGRVEKAKHGWSLGLQRYELRQREEWMDDAKAVRAIASHQDQVVVMPAGAEALGAGELVPYAILAYREHPAISVQFHPEFGSAFARALFQVRRLPDVDESEALNAIQSVAQPNDNARIGRWIDNFLSL